jgi:hypothetical protein
MWSKSTHRSAKTCSGIALIAFLSAALSLPAHAMEKWNINMDKSHFSAGTNTLALDRVTNSPTTAGRPAGGTFVVIAGDKVYLATDEAAFDAASGKTIRPVDYTRWKDMKIVQIGWKVRSNDHCDFHCQAGHIESHRTLTFTAVGGDPSPQMRNVVVLNTQ